MFYQYVIFTKFRTDKVKKMRCVSISSNNGLDFPEVNFWNRFYNASLQTQWKIKGFLNYKANISWNINYRHIGFYIKMNRYVMWQIHNEFRKQTQYFVTSLLIWSKSDGIILWFCKCIEHKTSKTCSEFSCLYVAVPGY